MTLCSTVLSFATRSQQTMLGHNLCKHHIRCRLYRILRKHSDYIYMMMSYNKNFASYSAGVKKAVNKAIDKLEGKIEERYGE